MRKSKISLLSPHINSILNKGDENTFELAKLAVTEKHQGLKIAIMLMKKYLNISKQKKLVIILYAYHILTSAIALYKKFEFKETPLVNNKYIESDLKMVLEL